MGRPACPSRLAVGLCWLWLCLLLPGGAAQLLDADLIDRSIVDITNTWVTLTSGVPFLQDHSLVETGGLLVAFGGWSADTQFSAQIVSGAVYVYDVAAQTWSQPAPGNASNPLARYDHTAVVYGGRMYIYGGQAENGTLADLWAYDPVGNAWTQVNGSGWADGAYPGAVSGHCAVAFGGLMYVFGGLAPSGQRGSTLWAYNFSANTWAALPQALTPSPRAYHTCAVYTNMSRIVPRPVDLLCWASPCIVLHAGEGQGTGALSDLWVYSSVIGSWSAVQYETGWFMLHDLDGATYRTVIGVGVTGRIRAQCIVVDWRLMCVGGYQFPGYADLVEYDPVFNRFLRPNFATELPFGLAGHRMLLASTGVVYVHGGTQASSRAFVTPTLVSSAYQRPMCHSGWAAPDGNWMCFPCLVGYAAFSGSYTCELCPTGTYASPAADNCTKCAAGLYQPLTGQSAYTACLRCTAGTYSPLPGAAACLACPAGRYESRAGSSDCLYCPAGTYRPSSNSTFATSVSSCPSCLAGQYSLIGSAICLPCPAGYYSNAGAQFCLPCPSGSWSTTGQGSCRLCPAGSFTTFFGSAAQSSGACQLCPPGSYTATSGQSACTQCAKGKYQPSAGKTTCLSCPAGTFGNVTGSSVQACYPCPPGSYNALTGQAQCIACPVATFSSEWGATSSSVCTACPDGTYSPSGGNSDPSGCLPCPAGYWGQAAVAGQGLTACYQCEPGTYQPEEGASSKAQCLPCPAMMYSAAGAPTCVSCGSDQFAHGGWQQCAACNETLGQAEGWVANGHFDLFWQAANWSDTDKWIRQAGSQTCERSSATDSQGNTRIKPESEYIGYTGKFTPNFLRYTVRTDGAAFDYAQTATLNMYNFPQVRVSAWTRGAYLTVYPGRQGLYQLRATFQMANGTAVRTFDFAPPGGNPGAAAWAYGAVLFQPTSILLTVKVELLLANFLKGGFVDWDDVSLLPYENDTCQCLATPGTYFSRTEIDAITESHCIWCLPSYACRAGVQFKCSAQEMSFGQSSACMACLPGWLCNFTWAGPCPYLTWMNEDTQTCDRCMPGYQCGEMLLVPCWPGTYGDGGYECIECLPGSFTNASGATFCYNCPPGTTSNYMRTECVPCPLNHYSPLGKECSLCPAGTYTSSTGAVQCELCSNITEAVAVTIYRNTFYRHINIVPAFCVGQVSFAILAIRNASLGNVTSRSPDGRSVTYYATAGAVGVDRVGVVVADATSGRSQTVQLQVTLLNRPPEGRADLLSIDGAHMTGTLAPLVNDYDPDQDPLMIDSYGWDGPNHNITVQVNADQTMTITFPATFFGNAHNLYYYVNDSLARAVNPTAIYLCRACSQPIAGDDSYTVPQGTSLRMAVLANDVDTDGDTMNVTAVTLSTQGVQPTTDGTTVTYTSPQGYCGTDQFAYTVSSTDGSAMGQVTVTAVNCVCSGSFDVLLLLDGSAAVTANGFLLQRQFAASVLSRMRLSDLQVHLGVLQYSTSPTIEIGLTGNASAVSSGLSSMQYDADVGRDIAYALSLASSHFSTNGRGTSFLRRLVLVSGGPSTSATDPVATAATLKTGPLPVHLYTVAVGPRALFPGKVACICWQYGRKQRQKPADRQNYGRRKLWENFSGKNVGQC